ncbi:MAG: hypothetical protein AB7H90_01020 [Alphaproteobacteria bacterium]
MNSETAAAPCCNCRNRLERLEAALVAIQACATEETVRRRAEGALAVDVRLTKGGENG